MENIINISELQLYECKMGNYQSKKYLWIYENINIENKLTKDNILTQCSNIIYPNDSKNMYTWSIISFENWCMLYHLMFL